MARKPGETGDPTLGPLIGDIGIDDLETKLAVALLNAAAQGSTAAAGVLVRLTEMSSQRQQARVHQARLAEAVRDEVALVRYLAELGLSPSDIEADWLGPGRTLAGPLADAFATGQRARLLESRALELGRARLGTAPVPEWMNRRFVPRSPPR